MQVVPAAQIPLEGVPTTLGQWTCTEQHANENYGVEVKTLRRSYRDGNGHEAQVALQGTYTRLGALRDWSLARTTGGWSIKAQKQVSLQLPGLGENIVVTLQDLGREKSNEIAVSWYVSSTRQAATLARAEVAAWGDRLAGRRLPWLSEYVTVPVADGEDRAAAEARALDLARRLAAALRAVAANPS